MANCGLSSAESNRTEIKYQKEDPACYGKLKTSGTRYTKALRVTSAEMNVEKETKVSEEIRADRMVSGTFALKAKSVASLDYEFARGTIDDFLAGYIGLEDWTKPMHMAYVRGDNVAFTANNTIEISGKDYTNVIVTGAKLKTEGFITPANNNYWTVSTITYASNKTTITTSETTAVVESGSAYTAVMDAEDVIVSGTTLQTNSTGFHAGGATVFAGPRAAGLLEPGRVIYAQGLGYEEGTLTFSGQPANSETFTVTDGTGSSVTFEFVTNAGTATAGNIEVVIGSDFDTTAGTLQTAIMGALNSKKLLCSASYNTTSNVLTIRNLSRTGGGSIAGTVSNVTIVNFSGGDSTVNGYFTITSVTDTQLDVTPVPTADTNASGKLVVLKGSHLAPPSTPANIKKMSFQLEEGHPDVNQYFLYKGQRVEKIEWNLDAGDLVSGSVDFTGSQATTNSSTVLGVSPYTQIAALTSPVYNATVNVKSLKKDGSTMSATVLSLGLEMATDLREQDAVGNYWPAGVGQGRLDITGSMEVYFENLDFYNDFINNNYIKVEMVLEDTDRWSYYVILPKLFMEEDKVTSGGIDEDVMEEISFAANLDDSLSNTEIIFNRFSSILPSTA